ncbi:HrpB2-like protein [Caballeronia calidae]|uniref:HrpB2-like protein n=1 Tax=Caballeronia calidae TaxID=1777139 RepID=A0A158EGJ8_9BURK|nr:hypothetical protein [Caballeronia calidae]SAL05830.1 HrpB2-like protein [Caballeronia calidae]
MMDAMTAVQSLDALADNTVAAPSSSLAGKFDQLMSQSRLVAPEHSESNGVDMARKVAEDQSASLEKMSDLIQSAGARLHNLPPQEMVAANIDLALEVGAMSMNMQIKMSLVNASKGSVETLMKNQ